MQGTGKSPVDSLDALVQWRARVDPRKLTDSDLPLDDVVQVN
jgi:hypothetical protein